MLENIPDRSLYYTDNSIDRQCMIWKLSVGESKMTLREIAAFAGCSTCAVFKARRKLRKVEKTCDVGEYFQMAYDLRDILAELRRTEEYRDYAFNEDYCVWFIMGALMREGVVRRTLIKNMTIEEAAEFTNKFPRWAGRMSRAAFLEYRYRLKHKRKYYPNWRPEQAEY